MAMIKNLVSQSLPLIIHQIFLLYVEYLSSTYRIYPFRRISKSTSSFNINRLVTLAIQNSALTLIMHHSLVSTPPSRAYSAATAVLLNEIFKGTISLVIAYARVDISSSYPSPYPLELSQGNASRWTLVSLPRLRKLCSDIFSPDCWKLSIPAILYGTLAFTLLRARVHIRCSHSK